MKSHISPKQAKEVTEEQFYSLFNEIVPREDWANYHHKKMDIAKMIGYLEKVSIENIVDVWELTVSERTYESQDLVDALWQAVKDELRKE